jgi:Ca-activated chloride channel family protein
MSIETIRRTLIVVVLLLLPGVQFGANATPPGHVDSPYFAVQGDSGLDQFPLKSTAVEARLNGVIASVHLTQVYRNQGKAAINARYIFPGSTRAAMGGLTMTIGNRRQIAMIKEKEQAAKLFAAAQAAGKSAALLAQHRPNVFSMDVANILPGDTVTIELDYSELLSATNGEYEFVYPGVVGPRYNSETGDEAQAAAHDTQWVANPYLHKGDTGEARFELKLEMVSPIPINELGSDTHLIQSSWHGARSVSVRLGEPGAAAATRDFILRYRLQGAALVTGVTRFKLNSENYFLLLAEPPQRVAAAEIPPREYLFVLDVSGSMAGFPLDTARTLMTRLIDDLGPRDAFNILYFSGGSEVMAPAPLPATPENKANAKVMLANMNGNGATELLPALHKALAMPRGEQSSRSLVLITDGYVSAEGPAFKLIDGELGDSNLFAFGIGSSVNRFLIEGLAKVGRAESFVVTDASSAAREAERFRRYISAPVLTHIEVQGENAELYDLEPAIYPDLLAERPLMVLGKYRGAGGQATIRLSGQGGDGPHAWNFALADSAEDPGLPRLWARKRLERLYVFPGAAQDSRAEILQLGLKYSLLTSATSFVAIDDTVRNAGEAATDVKQPLPLPSGVENSAVGGELQPMPEPETWWLASWALLLLSARLARVYLATAHADR